MGELLARHRNLVVELSWVLLDRIVDGAEAAQDWVHGGRASTAPKRSRENPVREKLNGADEPNRFRPPERAR
ncbi:MAG: hypothetical protein WAW17_20140 [Rhodococcus sp. (in: high G+C Gram-positive bacteria)]|uniref:hypothetical protein n=1 Tax=Rhodococcus sp. TaxID=1831 RepID=UPI003BAF1C36